MTSREDIKGNIIKFVRFYYITGSGKIKHYGNFSITLTLHTELVIKEKYINNIIINNNNK